MKNNFRICLKYIKFGILFEGVKKLKITQ